MSYYGLIAALAAGLLICPLVRAQNAMSGTTLGKSQNSPEDLFNSLVPGPKRFDKGEKKEEVDPKKLPSKTIHDKTFQGNLMDIGLDWTGDKMGKPNVASAESKTVKPAETEGEKDPKAAAKQSDPVGDKEKASKQGDAAGDAKKQKAAAVSSDEKSSDANKPLANKTDGDR